MKKLFLILITIISVFAGEAEEYLNKGIKAVKHKDYIVAFKYFKKSCDLGNSLGCANCGVCYAKGTGVTKNNEKSIKYFKKSCHMGSKEACKILYRFTSVIFSYIDNKNINKLKKLLNDFNEVNVHDKHGDTPLIYAVSHGKTDLELIKYLVSHGADVNIINTLGKTPLMVAVSNGNIDMVRYLVLKGANINVKDKLFGDTPLMVAASNGNIDMVRYLVSKGADINAKDRFGKTPLNKAKDYKFIVKYLQQKGAK